VNSLETQELIDLIAAYSPSMPLAENTTEVWGAALADIPADAATAAVHEHFAVTGPFIAVADIRRRVANQIGALPPDPETAYAQALRFRHWLDRRIGPEPSIHPAALACARTVGWLVFDEDDRYARGRFVAGYAAARDEAMRELATTPYPVLAARLAEPKALPGGWGVLPPEAPPPNPDGQVAIRRMIAGLADVYTPAVGDE